MLKNILKTAIRNILRDKGYSILNLLGLTISITASLLLIIYISHELSYEDFHVKKDRIYRIVSHFQERDDEFSWASTQPPLAKQLKSDYPDEVEEYTRINGIGKLTLRYGDKINTEDNLVLGDSTYFKIFTHKFLEGDPATCLDEPNSLVLTKSTAEKYFGDNPAAGETLIDNDGESVKVTAVIEDLPRNTHADFDGIVSLNSIENLGGGWGSFYIYTYVLLKENISGEGFKSRLPEMITKYVDPIFEQYGVSVKYELQNIGDIHLYSKTDGEEGGGDIAYIYIFSIVAIFMLVIAAINYMNLATARSERRAREVGIRKVLGSYRWMLTTQFISESLLLTLTALAIALCSIAFLIEPFNAVTSREFLYSDVFQPDLILSILFIILVLGFFGGSYPALYLSSFKPIKVLKGRFSHGKGTVPLRKILVITQFAISIAMIISTVIVYDQLTFLRNKDLGFAKDQVMVTRIPDPAMFAKLDVLKTELLQKSNIVGMATASSSPGRGYPKNLLPIETKDGFVEKGVNHYSVDQDYIPTLEFNLIQGRNFSKDLASDSNAVIVNKLFAERNGWGDEALGKRIRVSDDEDEEVEYLTVIGVLEDFHQLSLYQKMEPLAFFYRESSNFVHIKFNPENLDEVKSDLNEVWTSIYPDVPLEYYFLDQRFYESYEADQKRFSVFMLFSGITIFIACLGLLGLASFSAEQRTKEIGIRKVIGADEKNIIFLLTKDFFILVAIGMAIASVSAYFLMQNWLEQSFVYHTNIRVLAFILSGFLAFIFVILTVGFQAYKAANKNPVLALRSE